MPKSAQDIAESLRSVAAEIADCPDLDARDRNALIGQLRGVYGQVIGLAGSPGFKQAPFAPTTKASSAPEPSR